MDTEIILYEGGTFYIKNGKLFINSSGKLKIPIGIRIDLSKGINTNDGKHFELWIRTN